MAETNSNGQGRRAANGNATLTSQQSVNARVKAICDIMRRANAAGAMQYVPELSWLLFLRILDEREQEEEGQATMMGLTLQPEWLLDGTPLLGKTGARKARADEHKGRLRWNSNVSRSQARASMSNATTP